MDTKTELPLMKCGCVAMATCSSKGGVKFDPPIPSCVVHDCIEVANGRPDLTGRMAECAYLPHGHAKVPSSYDLPFFEFCGEGSREGTELCKCGYTKNAHENGRVKCREFAAKGPRGFDRYYCGCRGWD